MLETIIYYINVFFFIYMFIYALVFFFTTFLAALKLDDFFIGKKHKNSLSLKDDNNYIPISIIVPAYNEELTVVDTVKSLLCLDYPEYEICVVNDGSKDDTLNVLIKEFNLKEIKRPIHKQVVCKKEKSIYENDDKVRIILVDKANGGKSDSLNMGINISKYPLFICMDADSMLQKDSLKRIVEPFLSEDNTIAVGGNVKVSNNIVIQNGMVKKVNMPKKLIVKFQLIEYLRVFLTSRVSFNNFNANLIISGAFGLYKKSAVIAVGGYSTDTMGEDMELIVKMHAYFHKNKKQYNISYVPDSICYTQVPENMKVLRKQRRRWHTGMGESLRKHMYMLFNPTYGTVGMMAFPYFVLFEYITPFLEILGLITIIVSWIIGIINLQFFVIYLLVYMGFNLIVSFVSVLLERHMFKETMDIKMMFKLFFYCVLESFGYRQCCSLFRLSSVFSKGRHSWGTMERRKNQVS